MIIRDLMPCTPSYGTLGSLKAEPYGSAKCKMQDFMACVYGCGSKPCTTGDQNRWQTDDHPPQHGAIGYAPWPYRATFGAAEPGGVGKNNPSVSFRRAAPKPGFAPGPASASTRTASAGAGTRSYPSAAPPACTEKRKTPPRKHPNFTCYKHQPRSFSEATTRWELTKQRPGLFVEQSPLQKRHE